MANTPDRLYIARGDRGLYDEVNKEGMLKYKDRGGTRTRKEQFLFAMATGFKSALRQPMKSRDGGGFFLSKDLHDEDVALLNAVALADTGSPQVLLDRAEVFRIAEEYAHAGIRLLADRVGSTSFASFEKRLEKELRELAKQRRAG